MSRWGSTSGSDPGALYGAVFLVIMAVFGLVHSPWALLALPVMLLGGLVFAVLGMAYTAYVRNIEHFNIFFTAILTPMFLFSGIFFPFDELPQWAQIIGWSLPLSHLVEALRRLTSGEVGLQTVGHVAVLAGVLLVLFPIPLARLRRTLVG